MSKPTNERIVLSASALAVQEIWEPEIGDLCLIFIGKNAHPFRLTYKTFQMSAKHHIKKLYTFIPDAAWCAERKEFKYNLIEIIYNHSDNPHWMIITDGTPEPFTHANYDTVHLMACEFVLSGGKNDLRIKSQ